MMIGYCQRCNILKSGIRESYVNNYKMFLCRFCRMRVYNLISEIAKSKSPSQKNYLERLCYTTQVKEFIRYSDEKRVSNSNKITCVHGISLFDDCMECLIQIH